MTAQAGDVIAVWFSCGAASAIALQETLRLYGNTCTVRALNTPVAEEHPDNRRFADDVSRWLGIEIETVTHPDYPASSAVEVWRRRGAMSFAHGGAPCTTHLKKEARQHWETANKPDWHVLGFTAEERHRHENFTKTERSNLLPVLIDAGLSKADCAQRLVEAGVRIPDIYRLGFPNANCIGCVKATSPTYWNHVRQTFPDVFDERAKQSRELGVRLARVKNDRVFLDELDPSAQGAPLKSIQHECGLFCEEATQ